MANLKELFEFPTILIVIGSILLVAAVIVGIIAYKKPSKKELEIDIEEELENPTLEDSLEKIKTITETKKEEEQVEEIAVEEPVIEKEEEVVEEPIVEKEVPVLVEEEELVQKVETTKLPNDNIEIIEETSTSEDIPEISEEKPEEEFVLLEEENKKEEVETL